MWDELLDTGKSMGTALLQNEVNKHLDTPKLETRPAPSGQYVAVPKEDNTKKILLYSGLGFGALIILKVFKVL